jgi:hypothetical protein
VVLSCTTVHVRREGRPKKYPARVLCCAPAVDLALLTVARAPRGRAASARAASFEGVACARLTLALCVFSFYVQDDDAFWENLNPLALADVPHLQDSVVVVGYPVGGKRFSASLSIFLMDKRLSPFQFLIRNLHLARAQATPSA